MFAAASSARNTMTLTSLGRKRTSVCDPDRGAVGPLRSPGRDCVLADAELVRVEGPAEAGRRHALIRGHLVPAGRQSALPISVCEQHGRQFQAKRRLRSDTLFTQHVRGSWSPAMTQSQGLVERARLLAGLSRAELARRSGASRPLAAYAAGAKSPTLSTAERIVRSAGFDLELVPRPAFREAAVGRGHAVYVPEFLPRLPVDQALGRVRLPLHLNWSQPGREFDLSDRRQRARVYEIVLREGSGDDISQYIDGALLADLWPALVLPRPVRQEWQPLIDAARGHVVT